MHGSGGIVVLYTFCNEGNLLDETSCLGVEELVVGLRSECSAGRGEACDVVVGRGGLAVGHSSRSHCRCVWVGGFEWVRVFPEEEIRGQLLKRRRERFIELSQMASTKWWD